MTLRILIAGFQHETNTFAPSPATYENFVRGEVFPAMARGHAVHELEEVNIAIGGFMQAMKHPSIELLPVLWAGASPSSRVTADAFERIAGEIVDAAAALSPDGIYLDLHGAMVTQLFDDGEGELLRRLRAATGLGVPIVASLDLHANVTQDMLDNADALVAYRTYPHVDMAITGGRAARILRRLLEDRRPLHKVMRRLPFLIPINGQCTMLQPARGAYERLAALEAENESMLSLSFATGFPAADFPECGATVWGYAADLESAIHCVEDLYQHIVTREPEWRVPFLSPNEAVREAMRIVAGGALRPVVIADTQDNPGAGGNSDTTGMLRALIEEKAPGAAIGLIVDPAAARLAHEAGVGAKIEIALGGRSGVPGDAPYFAIFTVEQLSDGRCRFNGPMMTGMAVDVGPTARLSTEGVQVVVSSTKTQMLDRNLYRMVGIEPERMRILVNKSSVHFRADFEPFADGVLVAKAPGPMMADPADLPWTRLPLSLRLTPAAA